MIGSLPFAKGILLLGAFDTPLNTLPGMLGSECSGPSLGSAHSSSFLLMQALEAVGDESTARRPASHRGDPS